MIVDHIFIDKPSQLDTFIPHKVTLYNEISIRENIGALNVHDLKKKFWLFHRFIAYNVIPEKSH